MKQREVIGAFSLVPLETVAARRVCGGDITLHVIVNGAARAAGSYGAVFGAVEQGRITLPDGRLIHVELAFGESRMMLADEFPEHQALAPAITGQSSAVFYCQVPDLETVWARAIDAGARVHRPIAGWFTGERDGKIVDPFGHRWALSQKLRDDSPAEVAREAARVFGGGQR